MATSELLNLITGHTGTAHVSSADDAAIWRGIVGNNNVTLFTDEQLVLDYQTKGKLTISDGVLCIGGRMARISNTKTVDYELPASGFFRRTKLVAEYMVEYDTESQDNIESVRLITLQNDPLNDVSIAGGGISAASELSIDTNDLTDYVLYDFVCDADGVVSGTLKTEMIVIDTIPLLRAAIDAEVSRRAADDSAEASQRAADDAALDGRVSALESYESDSRISTLESWKTSKNTADTVLTNRVSALESYENTSDSRISTLESWKTNKDLADSTLNSRVNVLDKIGVFRLNINSEELDAFIYRGTNNTIRDLSVLLIIIKSYDTSSRNLFFIADVSLCPVGNYNDPRKTVLTNGDYSIELFLSKDYGYEYNQAIEARISNKLYSSQSGTPVTFQSSMISVFRITARSVQS